MMPGHLKGLHVGPEWRNCPCLVSSFFFSPGAGLSHNLTPEALSLIPELSGSDCGVWHSALLKYLLLPRTLEILPWTP